MSQFPLTVGKCGILYLFFEIRDLWKIIAGLEATEEEESGETFLHQHRGCPQISLFFKKKLHKMTNKLLNN
jgi:hypothetical protein